MNSEINEVARILADADSLLVITGAGISAESGLRTYRGKQGLYEEWLELTAVLSAEGLARQPAAVWGLYQPVSHPSCCGLPQCRASHPGRMGTAGQPRSRGRCRRGSRWWRAALQGGAIGGGEMEHAGIGTAHEIRLMLGLLERFVERAE